MTRCRAAAYVTTGPNSATKSCWTSRWPTCRFPSKARSPSRIAQLRDELDDRGLRFPLHFYLSDEWFTPDGATAIAIPFYLAHPRLERLEEAQMFEVEGGEHEWCMRILRHEAGHAIDNAYRCACAAQRRARSSARRREPYPEFYTPKPYSKSFVLHLDAWYAQSHPDEDFAETFAVWLTPQQRMAPALRRLAGAEEARIHGRADALARAAGAARRQPGRDRSARAPAQDARQHYRASGGTTASTTRTSTTATCGASSPTRPSSPATSTAAQFIGRIRRPVRRARRELDRHLPVHDRSGARGHDRALPRAEAAARRARGAARGRSSPCCSPCRR